MFRLKLPTDPRWATIAEQHVEEILTDHAYCEQKAASTAISLIVNFPEYPELVKNMADLAQEEMEHFKRVHDFLLKRGYTLGKERKDPYVNDLMKFLRKGHHDKKIRLIDQLLFAAMIEARSCERFKVLSENIQDKELAEFYRELMESEASHYTMFITLARSLAPREEVDARWNEFLEYEAKVIAGYGKKETIHG
ncbi:MAG: tRNA-(ms[2]io[6]A)-hydroxylase [Flavobacteriales bacterium]|nr:tRNA-(ms[2]io[6]A)-hydroxylase [Flavobacteriales bacterium]